LNSSIIEAADEVLWILKKKYDKRGLQSWNQNTAHLRQEKKESILTVPRN
jgi:hypothetical protein